MSLLEPNWSQPKPSWREAQTMCGRINLEPVQPEAEEITRVIDRLRDTHSNGGAFLAVVRLGPDHIFDWFASRNRLPENDILPLLLSRDQLRDLVPEVKIPLNLSSVDSEQSCSIASSGGFSLDNPFLLEGQLATRLFRGGAYGSNTKISGKAAMQLAADFCELAFGRRYEEVSLFTSYAAWTEWFSGIAWDWTSVFFDGRTRMLWTLLVTDTD